MTFMKNSTYDEIELEENLGLSLIVVLIVSDFSDSEMKSIMKIHSAC